MSDLIRLAVALAESSAVSLARQATARTARVLAAAAAAAGCAIAAVACVLAALWIYALPHVGAIGAPLVVAGVLLVMCLAVLMLMRYRLKRRPAPPAAGAAPALLLAEATRLFKEHKGPVLMAALLAGLVAGRNGK
jgi:hypothetical protein